MYWSIVLWSRWKKMVGPRRGFQCADVGIGRLGGNGGEGTATELRSGSDGSISLVEGWVVLSILIGVSSGVLCRRAGGVFLGGASPFPIDSKVSLSLHWVEVHWSGGRMVWANGGGWGDY